MKSVFDPTFKYTPAKEQGSDYLQKKFAKIRAEQKKQAEAKVQPFVRKSWTGTK